MSRYLLLVSPSANRVYGGDAARLAAAELALCVPGAREVEPAEVAGVGYVAFAADDLDPAAVARLSATLALFAREGDLLRPVAAPSTDLLGDDLVSIPKYQGKTNEQFTRLLVDVTLAAVARAGRLTILDPLCGRGTTLSVAWQLGCDAAGVEGDEKAVEAYAGFLKTYLRRARIKHTADLTPVRREGRAVGKRLDATAQLGPGLTLAVMTGDTRDSARLYGRRTFDAIVTDAPYGVVHGAHTDVRGTAGKRDRSPAGLLREAIPVWAGQLRAGGAMGIAWNTFGLARADLLAIMGAAGLEPLDTPAWRGFEHRVDSSIVRDLAVATKPRG